MKAFLLVASLALLESGCADFERGFMESANQVNSGSYAGAWEQPSAPTPIYCPPQEPIHIPQLNGGWIMQGGRPLATYSTGPFGTWITPTTPGEAPIIIQ